MVDASAERSELPEDQPAALPFAVVGVGASAGGLKAVGHLLEALPPKPGLSVILVIHQDPHFKSELPAILGRLTSMPIVLADEGMKVEIDHVYLGPPDAIPSLAGGILSLSPRPRRGLNMPIDHLFRALAHAQKSRAVGVILSGDGTDGSLGFQAIKAEGGITFAQDEKSARHYSMPRSAALDGTVDYVLPPEQIARELVRVTRHSYSADPAPARKPDAWQTIEQIIAFVRTNTEVDFSHYKRTTIHRRIQRRMALLAVERFDEYLKILRQDPSELRGLYQDFLIRVTQFFRDPEAFEAVKEKVFGPLVESRSAGAPLRFWVAGCSTGEEVYSLAIALQEVLAERGKSLPVKILATDLNEASLEKARAGVYLDNIEIDVSAERLRKFFLRAEGSYQISKSIREQCVFSRHNLANDPPFSRLDLVSCRNVLIYMDIPLQRRVLPILHYALNPGGMLFLGSSENIGPFTDLFTGVDPKNRIFGKKQAAGSAGIDFTSYVNADAPRGRPGRDESALPIWSALDVQREADRIILARFAPVGVVIDETMTVLQFRGRTAAYLEPAPGLASLDLMRMLREGLMAEVRAAVQKAKTDNCTAVKENLRVAEAGTTRLVRVEVIPFRLPPSGARFFLVLFQDDATETAFAPPAGPAETHAPPEGQSLQLQQELTALREYLQSVIEEQESTNEELKSANEEILSANEELQSTNEELQTAKEESQSANEELATVNEELRHRNAELAWANNDLVNLLSGVNIPIVMVGRDLRIRRFTPLAEKVFNLIPTDMGRPITDIKTNLLLADLGPLLRGVIDTLATYESEVQDKDGHWYSLRIRPYVTLDNKIDGASIVLIDVGSIRKHPGPGTPVAGNGSPEARHEGS